MLFEIKLINKMAKVTFWDIIKKTVEKVGTPLSAKEIWDKSIELDLVGDFRTTGKTPWATIAAYCYTDINDNGDDSIVIQTSERPAQFFLRNLVGKVDVQVIQNKKDTYGDENEQIEEKKVKERDLHQILVAYAYGNSHFKANLKTVFHETSVKVAKGQNEWLHPDLVGAYFPFRDFKNETIELQKSLSVTSVKLFSFEMKITINFTNLRQYYFQAVSNSSWANEGYLVAMSISKDLTLREEIRRLNNAFGIGIIELNCENVAESEILFPAKYNQEIDWDSVNRLASDNPDFKDFLKSVAEDCQIGKVKSQYDKILNLDDIAKIVKDKGMSATISK